MFSESKNRFGFTNCNHLMATEMQERTNLSNVALTLSKFI